MKFPPIIHVTVENAGTEDEFLMIHDNVNDFAVVGEKVSCALYKLVEIGSVTANPIYKKGK